MIQCLEPIVDERAKLFILGSMPGEQSLQLQQYYANPRNHFWRLMSEVLGCSLQGGYEERVKRLQEHGIALWDVLAECEREGSLDSAIRGERANDIGALLVRYSSIRAVCFNGGKAEQSFKRYLLAPRPAVSGSQASPAREGLKATTSHPHPAIERPANGGGHPLSAGDHSKPAVGQPEPGPSPLPLGIAMERLPSSSPTPGRNVLGFAEKATVWASVIRPLLLDIGP